MSIELYPSCEPVHPWRLCGPPAVPLEAGVLSFQNRLPSSEDNRRPLRCVWDITGLDSTRGQRSRFSSLVFTIGNITLPRLQAQSCQGNIHK